MARLWLIAVLLLLSASAGSSVNCQVKVDQNQKPTLKEMKEIVDELWNRLNEDKRKFPMFSLAVSIPYNKKKEYDVKNTFAAQKMKDQILGCGVYTTQTMVASTVLKWPDVLKQCPNAQVPWADVLDQCDKDHELNTPPKRRTWNQVNQHCRDKVIEGRADHAEYRVLQNFKTLKDNPNNKQEFMLFYVYASPCDRRCANTTSPFNILDSIKVIKEWANYAVVFSKVFVPKGGAAVTAENPKGKVNSKEGRAVSVTDPKGALKQLGEKIKLENIYRCDAPEPCKSCSSGNGIVTPYCYE